MGSFICKDKPTELNNLLISALAKYKVYIHTMAIAQSKFKALSNSQATQEMETIRVFETFDICIELLTMSNAVQVSFGLNKEAVNKTKFQD